MWGGVDKKQNKKKADGEQDWKRTIGSPAFDCSLFSLRHVMSPLTRKSARLRGSVNSPRGYRRELECSRRNDLSYFCPRDTLTRPSPVLRKSQDIPELQRRQICDIWESINIASFSCKTSKPETCGSWLTSRARVLLNSAFFLIGRKMFGFFFFLFSRSAVPSVCSRIPTACFHSNQNKCSCDIGIFFTPEVLLCATRCFYLTSMEGVSSVGAIPHHHTFGCFSTSPWERAVPIETITRKRINTSWPIGVRVLLLHQQKSVNQD